MIPKAIHLIFKLESVILAYFFHFVNKVIQILIINPQNTRIRSIKIIVFIWLKFS